MTIAECENQMDKMKETAEKLCKKKQVREAINVLKEINKNFLESKDKKQPLLDEPTDTKVLLQITMKKIPPKKLAKRIRVALPHSMATDTTEVCLITGDLDKKNKKAEIDADVLHYKELLKSHGITQVSEVVTLRQLRTEYKVYEARRQLEAAYDVFLCDKKIAQCLPNLLGKIFIQKRKFPIEINMETPNLKNQIEKALSETVFSVTCRGNSCTSDVARLGMDDDKILKNVLASVKVLADELPGKQNNILGIYIKTAKSQAIPIFMSFGNPNDVKIEKPRYNEKVELEELSTLPNAEVKVFRDGKIFVKKYLGDDKDRTELPYERKGRHGRRKRNMNESVDVDIDENNLGKKSESEFEIENIEEDTSSSKTKLQKKRKALPITESAESKDCSKASEKHSVNEMVEDIEEDTSPSKSKLKKKRKANAKNMSLGSKENEESKNPSKAAEKPSINETEVEDMEDTSQSKTKLKKKHKSNAKNKALGIAENEESKDYSKASEKSSINETEFDDIEGNTSPSKSKLKKKRNALPITESEESKDYSKAAEKHSVNEMVKDIEEDTSPSKSSLKKKRKANAKNISLESTENEESEVSSKVAKKHFRNESKIKDMEENVDAPKSRLRSQRGKTNENENQEGEKKNIKKRKSVNAFEDLNASKTQLKMKKKKTTNSEIEETISVLTKGHPKVKSPKKGKKNQTKYMS